MLAYTLTLYELVSAQKHQQGLGAASMHMQLHKPTLSNHTLLDIETPSVMH